MREKKRIVYVPSYEWDYEGGDWVGVYSTEERAMAALVKHCGDDCNHDQHWMTAIFIDGEGIRERSHEVFKEQIRDLARAKSGRGA